MNLRSAELSAGLPSCKPSRRQGQDSVLDTVRHSGVLVVSTPPWYDAPIPQQDLSEHGPSGEHFRVSKVSGQGICLIGVATDALSVGPPTYVSHR